jgi:hypothetical protein
MDTLEKVALTDLSPVRGGLRVTPLRAPGYQRP